MLEEMILIPYLNRWAYRRGGDNLIGVASEAGLAIAHENFACF